MFGKKLFIAAALIFGLSFGGLATGVFAKPKKEVNFKVRIENISNGAGLATADGSQYPFALSPGMFVVSNRKMDFFKAGKKASEGLERQAEDGNPDHVGAPMPGLIVSVSVNDGDKVKRGDVLVAIEAMKMETSIFAERDGVIDKVFHHVGAQVDTKDLLVVMEPE